MGGPLPPASRLMSHILYGGGGNEGMTEKKEATSTYLSTYLAVLSTPALASFLLLPSTSIPSFPPPSSCVYHHHSVSQSSQVTSSCLLFSLPLLTGIHATLETLSVCPRRHTNSSKLPPFKSQTLHKPDHEPR